MEGNAEKDLLTLSEPLVSGACKARPSLVFHSLERKIPFFASISFHWVSLTCNWRKWMSIYSLFYAKNLTKKKKKGVQVNFKPCPMLFTKNGPSILAPGSKTMNSSTAVPESLPLKNLKTSTLHLQEGTLRACSQCIQMEREEKAASTYHCTCKVTSFFLF